jgi:FAD synthase
MRASLFGELCAPAVAVVGVWDPLLPAHLELFEQLCAYAHGHGLDPLAIVLDPDPGVLRFGAARWPTYDEVHTRIRLIRRFGPKAVVRASFTSAGLAATAAELFAAVRSRVTLAELWLGAHQPLGAGDAGSPETVARLAIEYGVRIVRLPETGVASVGGQVRRLLATGHVRGATELVGRPPVRSRPRSGRLAMAWHPGHYRVLPCRAPLAPLGERELEVSLDTQSDGRAGVGWPVSSASHLAFVSGPADQG